MTTIEDGLRDKFKRYYATQTLKELRKLKSGLLASMRQNPSSINKIRFELLERAIAEKSKGFGVYS